MVTVKGEYTATSLLKLDFFLIKHPLSHTFSIGEFRADSKAYVNEVGSLLSSVFNI